MSLSEFSAVNTLQLANQNSLQNLHYELELYQEPDLQGCTLLLGIR